jgi:dihydroflavonol-4-reductase
MVAITGANGLLGSFILKKLLDEKMDVVGIKRKESDIQLLDGYQDKITWREADILDAHSLEESLKGIHVVIHAAASVSFNPRHSKKIYTVNVDGTKNIVNACLKIGIPRLIHISSVAALGRQKGITHLNEESKWIDSSLNSDYAESKYLAELEVFRGQEEGLSTVIINPSIIMAPADWAKSSAKIFKYVWDSKPFYTTGSLNYVDVRDVTDMAYSLCSSKIEGERIIANGGTVTYQFLFEEIAKRFNKKAPRISIDATAVAIASWFEEMRSRITQSEPMFTRQSSRMACEQFQYENQKAMILLGFKFRTLQDTLDWCCAYYMVNVSTNK